MDKKRRKKSQGWFEREGESLVQRSKPRQARFEEATAGRRLPARFFLREDEGYEKEADLGEDSTRPE